MITINKRWSIIDVILVFVLLVVLMGLTNGFAPKIKGLLSGIRILGLQSKLAFFFVAAFLQSVYIIGTIWVIKTVRRLTWRDLGLHTQNFGLNALIGIGGGLVLCFTVILLSLLMLTFTKKTPPAQDVAQYLVALNGQGKLVLAVLLGSIMAPLSEELYFRGLVFPVLRDRFGLPTGLIASGLFFSLMHRDLFRLIPIAVGGIGLALLYDRTKSLWTSIIAHSTWNTIMLLLMVLSSKFVS